MLTSPFLVQNLLLIFAAVCTITRPCLHCPRSSPGIHMRRYSKCQTAHMMQTWVTTMDGEQPSAVVQPFNLPCVLLKPVDKKSPRGAHAILVNPLCIRSDNWFPRVWNGNLVSSLQLKRLSLAALFRHDIPVYRIEGTGCSPDKVNIFEHFDEPSFSIDFTIFNARPHLIFLAVLHYNHICLPSAPHFVVGSMLEICLDLALQFLDP